MLHIYLLISIFYQYIIFLAQVLNSLKIILWSHLFFVIIVLSVIRELHEPFQKVLLK